MAVANAVLKKTIGALIETHGDNLSFRIQRGVEQVAGLWTTNDGNDNDFTTFCRDYFIADDAILNETMETMDRVLESINGHFNAMMVDLSENVDLDVGEIRPLDMKLAEYEPSAHITPDFFSNKIAFIVLLNFPHFSLEEKRRLGHDWDTRLWARARLGDVFHSRLPADIQQKTGAAITAASAYIDEYNIYLGMLRSNQAQTFFPEDLKLITHWGLRDELKGQYGREHGLECQDMIYEVMKRIITQEIPATVINNPDVTWNPYDNTVFQKGKKLSSTAEADVRYRHLLNIFHCMREQDAHYPAYPTYIARKFELEREMTEAEVEALFVECLASPVRNDLAALIRQRLGRDLKPFDIWYDGFKSRGALSEADLDETVTARYPDVESFQNDLPGILSRLGFTRDQILYITPRIVVDPSRGAGHAWGASMKDGVAHLRTRVPADGFNYKGYNIAVHEFGHTVEQTISVQEVDYSLLYGVPCSAFSEAFAFVFQERDLELLGIDQTNDDSEHLKALDRFWASCEIMAVALVDMKIWRWLYDHPDAGVPDLKKAVLEISKEIWNRYFADMFGSRDEIILGIYSHMVSYPLYLAEYPIGHIIEFQVERYLKGKNLGEEMERMCSAGKIIPQLWMKNAVGEEISVKPLLNAVKIVLDAM